MLSIKVRSAAEAQAIFDAVRGPRTWVEPKQCRGWHHVIAQTAKREDAEAILSALHISAKVREF